MIATCCDVAMLSSGGCFATANVVSSNVCFSISAKISETLCIEIFEYPMARLELLKYRVRKCHLINCEKEGRRSTCSFFFAVLKPGMSKCLEKFSRTSVIVLLLS